MRDSEDATSQADRADSADQAGVWDEVVGQPDAVTVLRQAAAAAARIVAGGPPPASGQMTHAWLFTGPPGSGRSVAARAFTAALECPHGGCGQCSHCRTVRAGTHADLHLVVPAGLSIAVGEMREIVRTAARRPSAGRWQVVLVEDADRLTEAASNALLKAIEEPPERSVFLLCAPSTHPDDVSVTIRSRCRVVALRTPAADAVAGVLVRRDGIASADADWAARAAQGHVGRARRLARDPQARQRRQAVLSIPASLTGLAACFAAADELVRAAEAEAKALSDELDGPEKDALKIALGGGGTGKGTAGAARGTAGAVKEMERRQKSRATRAQRDALDRALVDLAGCYRDVLACQFGADVAPAHPDMAAEVRRLAGLLTPESVLHRLDAVLACRRALELNVKPRIAVEAMTVALRLP
ncbi:MAG TPA: DNA polymerase III subunit delta' [Mycobacteriales bacterium]|nr:DNA polymerase III subunit delta' [Mycobacteriales bacterium]